MQFGTHVERGPCREKVVCCVAAASFDRVPDYVNQYSNPGSVLESTVAKSKQNLGPGESLDRCGLEMRRFVKVRIFSVAAMVGRLRRIKRVHTVGVATVGDAARRVVSRAQARPRRRKAGRGGAVAGAAAAVRSWK